MESLQYTGMDADFSDKSHIFIRRSAVSYLHSLSILECIPCRYRDLLYFKLSVNFRIPLLITSIWLCSSNSLPENNGSFAGAYPISFTVKSSANNSFSLSVISLFFFNNLLTQLSSNSPWLSSGFWSTSILFVCLYISSNPPLTFLFGLLYHHFTFLLTLFVSFFLLLI